VAHCVICGCCVEERALGVVDTGLTELEVHSYLFVVDTLDDALDLVQVREGAFWVVFFQVALHDADPHSCCRRSSAVGNLVTNNAVR
jgi:hypothetical protein